MRHTNHMTNMMGWMLGCIILAVLVLIFAPRSLGSWAFLLLPLVCILAHVFMMKDHSTHGGDPGRDRPEDNQHNH